MANKTRDKNILLSINNEINMKESTVESKTNYKRYPKHKKKYSDEL